MDQRSRPRYLFVVPSSCQMYSGTGTAIFDWIRFASEAYHFTILMDCAVQQNVEITRDFCKEHGHEFVLGRPDWLPGCIDVAIKETASEIMGGRYDLVECVSWANAAANLHVLAALPAETTLLYTPHTQPVWTVGDRAYTACIAYGFGAMLERSQAVFLDSAAEAELPLFQGASDANLHVVPLGVDIERFRPGGPRDRKAVLCVCDFRETRKRVDRLFAAFELAFATDPSLKLVLAGKGSDTCLIPPAIEPAVERHGYIDADDLLSLFQSAGVFMLMSDFEAFGLPIAEALCTGLPVLINRQDALVDLFGGLPGVVFTENENAEETADKLLNIVSDRKITAKISKKAQEKFSFANTYGRKLEIISRFDGDQKVRS